MVLRIGWCQFPNGRCESGRGQPLHPVKNPRNGDCPWSSNRSCPGSRCCHSTPLIGHFRFGVEGSKSHHARSLSLGQCVRFSLRLAFLKLYPSWISHAFSVGRASNAFTFKAAEGRAYVGNQVWGNLRSGLTSALALRVLSKSHRVASRTLQWHPGAGDTSNGSSRWSGAYVRLPTSPGSARVARGEE